MNFDIKRKFYSPALDPIDPAPGETVDPAPEETADYLVPRTRLENFLAKIADNPDAKEIEPRTRTERLLNEIAARLDALENGGGGSVPGGQMIVNVISTTDGADTTYTFDKTAKDVFDAFTKNGVVTVVIQYDPTTTIYNLVSAVMIDDTGYQFVCMSETFHANGENDYPSYSEGR